MKPPIAYYGSKISVASDIVPLLPPHEHYVEPYAGSLAVLLAKPRSKMETVNDLDGRLMRFWRVLRDRGEELARACALTPHSRAEYAAAREPADDELEDARRLWVLLTQSRTGTTRPVGWRTYVNPAGSGIGMPRYLETYVDRIAPAVERLHGVSLEARPALEVIASYGAHPGVLLYVDPPYLGSTRTRNYACEMGGETAHRELADALNACRAAVVLSGYPSPLYADLYAGWRRYEIQSVSTQGERWAGRTEVLWSNRVLGAQHGLFDSEVA
ncbi:DNA adenine methylase [Allonocardiopsis opalescens]|uniref:DNA adenine methylase n=1 Tax=Allonocardiopsis opalescens TaxID=1144618 RepID=A0A2T0PP32_9ACTN|nr:DNA adenine methylase [Allonocardiopsis opalescens]PRX90669.1 DNA adenine methylase [Allonocardiopsis opalescens]